MSKKAGNQKKTNQVSYIRTPLFQKIYATNVRGGRTSQDFRFELMNEKLLGKDEEVYVIDAVLILSNTGAKNLFEQLKSAIEDYESEFGVISTKPANEKVIPYT